jgi:quercetin dioxygenase-like cupin family protein
MPGKYMILSDVPPEILDWGQLRWLSNPPATGAKDLTVIDVTLDPGKGHNFHKHPDQEEVIVVIAGQVEQWLDRDKRLLGPGDSVFIPAGMVHASFNAGTDEARLAAILGPCVGDVGYVSVEVADEAPWNTLRP